MSSPSYSFLKILLFFFVGAVWFGLGVGGSGPRPASPLPYEAEAESITMLASRFPTRDERASPASSPGPAIGPCFCRVRCAVWPSVDASRAASWASAHSGYVYAMCSCSVHERAGPGTIQQRSACAGRSEGIIHILSLSQGVGIAHACLGWYGLLSRGGPCVVQGRYPRVQSDVMLCRCRDLASVTYKILTPVSNARAVRVLPMHLKYPNPAPISSAGCAAYDRAHKPVFHVPSSDFLPFIFERRPKPPIGEQETETC